MDIWRVQHPADRDYSYYSHVHKSYSRIDYFLVDSQLISQVIDTKYHSILISDHSPLTMSVDFSLPKRSYSWRFNPSLLTDGKFVEYINIKLKEFKEFNDNGEVSDSTLWETLKVVIRGHIISYESASKKEKERRLLEIQTILPTLELAYQKSKLSDDYNKIMKLKYEYSCILGGQINNLFLKMRQRHLKMGDKPDRLLARQLKGIQASRSIYSIKSKEGILLTNPKDINARFKDFYNELYSSNNIATHFDRTDFFEQIFSLEIPKLHDDAMPTWILTLLWRR